MKTTKFFKGLTLEEAIDKLLHYESMINYNTTPGQRITKRSLNAHWISCSRIYEFDLKSKQKEVESKLLNYSPSI